MYSILNHPEPSRSHVGRDVFRTCSSLVSTDPPYELHTVVAMAPARRNSLIGYSRNHTSSGTTLS